MHPINPNHEVVVDLLSRYTFVQGDIAALQHAANELSSGLRLSTEHVQAYSIPINQKLPAEIGTEAAAPYVHPINIASALASVAAAGGLQIDPGLQVYNQTAPTPEWQVLVQSQVAIFQIQMVAPAPPPPPPVAAVPPPPPAAVAPPPPPAPPAPAAPPSDLVSLVDAAISPSTVAANPVAPATPAAITTPAAYADYRDQNGHPETRPVIEGTATRVATPAAPAAAPAAPAAPAQHVTLEQARREAENAEAVGLPDPSVLAERRSESGRPQKSPFERKVVARQKVAAPPFWWLMLRHSASKLFAESPAQALDPSSTGAGPVQAYSVLVHLTQEILRCADGNLTVAQLRGYLREVETGIAALPDAEAINQIATNLFSTSLKGDAE